MTYHFAGFCLSTRRQCLYRDGTEISLSTKLYHLLLAFLQQPDIVLTKSDITRAAWPGQIVTDAAIAKQIQRLRELLNDTDRKVPLIETHRGMGYRLTCTVTPDYQPSVVNVGVLGGNRAWPRLAMALLALVIVAGWLALDSGVVRSTASTSAASTASTAATLTLQPVAGDASMLTEGAAEYFAMQLGAAADIAPVIALDGDPAHIADLASLKLTRSRSGPVAAIHLSHEGNAYTLTVSFRNRDEKNRGAFTEDSIAEVLERGVQWLRREVDSPVEAASPAPQRYALTSYFKGLATTGAGHTCERAMDYFRAAVTNDPDFHHAHLRLARCERMLGRSHKAAAIAAALLANALQADPNLLLEARLLAARAQYDLGNSAEARRYLKDLDPQSMSDNRPLQRLKVLAALTMLAQLDGDVGRAEALNQERLALAQAHYPLESYLTKIHLDLAGVYLETGQHKALAQHAEKARSLAEETGDGEMLIASYRYLAGSYFRNGDMDAAVQLALAARPIIDQTQSAISKAYFIQFSAMALNLRGLFEVGREYTESLRELSETSANPMYGAIADFTVMHRLYVQGAFAEAHALASSTRSRLEDGTGAHAAIPVALSFEAIAAARSGPIGEAAALVDVLETRYPGNPALLAPRLRARGHIAARGGRVQEGVELLRQAEARYRDTGSASVANYVAYELMELRLGSEPTPPWDDIARLSSLSDFDYPLALLQARAHAAEGNYIGATAALEEARLRGNDLWSDRNQLLLEEYRSVVTMADARVKDGLDPGEVR
ncbi:winged helix-turn-helix domain-containing protein [Haliea sp. E1-2-M8]|uniref:winged helix-turn-helix domain-containing protein n=1 Tax=Haliea sp. E1-2-M8 TaxID=3064706 RepID=UPI0027281E06|nr:winged helix-turn-helix domain-containing protein [Haliea sp. E1-2-M8]MDO8864068.1 winged helix-turn-helix domain-containing protein [Haliea sp. E1-2-M8]